MRKLAVALCWLTALSLLAQTDKQPTFDEALTQARSPLVLTGESLSGAGAEVLSRAVDDSRFVLLGEDHMSREIPRLAAAICDTMHPDAYAVEAGPEAAQFVGGLLGHPDRLDRVRDRNREYPGDLAFLDRREENGVAEHCKEASRNPRFELWGLDQEFVGSAGVLLRAMAATRPGPRTLAAIEAAEVQDRVAETRARASGKVSDLFLLASSEADLDPLRAAVEQDGNAATKKWWNEFLVSRRIYRMHFQGLPGSNKLRAELLKQHFVEDYTRFTQIDPQARVFFKFGGMHTGKGFSFLHQRDLGNFVAEQADLQGVESLHLFVVGARGVQSYPGAYGKPPVPQSFDLKANPDMSFLAPALARLLPEKDAGGGTTLTLFDLRQLRFRHLDLPEGWDGLIDRYDLLVIVPEFTASTRIE